MRRKMILVLTFVIVHIFYVTAFFPVSALAADNTAENEETLEERMNRLQTEFDDLKKQYDTEMKALKEQSDTREQASKREGAPHKASPVGSYGGIMNPDISVVADVQVLFTDNETNPNRNKIRVKEVELAFQGYLYPGIRADVIPAFEMVYMDDEVDVNVDLEEAYLTIHQIPYLSEYVPLELQAGRKLMNFGRLNPVHPHHWPFTDTPLIVANLFGEHPWFDDGIQGSLTIANPWDFFLKTTFGFWNGKKLGHTHTEEVHEHDGDDDGEDAHLHGEAAPVSWNGNVCLSRTVLGFSFGRRTDSLLGYSVAWDGSTDTVLHEVDLTLTLRFPGTFQRLRWQNALYVADIRIDGYRRYGGYSLLLTNLTKYWQVGCRYDQAQVLDPHEAGNEWAAGGFLTFYFTHSLYIRGHYRFRRMIDNIGEHNGYIQLVFGLGPHSHRLEN